MHKIYSFRTCSDYVCEVTFYNGDIKRCDMKILFEGLPDGGIVFANKEEFGEAGLDRSRDNIVWNKELKMNSEKMWYDGVLIGHIEIDDPLIRLANLIIENRTARGISQKELEQRTGIKQAEISKIERAEGNPSVKTIGKLFAGMGMVVNFDAATIKTNEYAEIPLLKSCEGYLEKGKLQGEFTTDDIELLPEDVYVELIDGVIYDMATPTSFHQFIISEIFFLFALFIRENNGRCTAMISPTGVWFDEDNKNFVIPDLLVVCDDSKIKKKGIVGTPDFILEVLSPSTSARDMRLKRDLYDRKGVREYWILDPYKKKLLLYHFEENNIEIYGFNEVVGVKIYNGDMSIDLNQIAQLLEKYDI